MPQTTAPFKAGQRIAVIHPGMGFSLVPGVIQSVVRSNSGTWRGRVRTEFGEVRVLLHPDYAVDCSDLEPATQAAWEKDWAALEKREVA